MDVQIYLPNSVDSETGDAHKRFSVHVYHRIYGATIYQSLRALTPVSQSLTVSVSEPEHFWRSSDFQRQYLQNAWDSETGDAHKWFSMHFYHRICGATIYQDLRAPTPVSQNLTVRGLRARALLVTSGDDIFKMHGIQRPAMLTNDSACISTIGYVVLQFIRASKRRPQFLKVWLLGDSEPEHF